MAPRPCGRMALVGTRWRESGVPRAGDYDARWDSLAAQGHNVHGEADLVEILLRESGASRVLDAGCGTGRVAIELARRGFSVVGVDSDATMLAVAHTKDPALEWIEADLTDLTAMADAEFDLAVHFDRFHQRSVFAEIPRASAARMVRSGKRLP